MASQTITYSDFSNGWTSFWSFHPDMMIGMNSSFYTFKDGHMYKHNTNATRNAFYYDFDNSVYFTYDSTLTTIFNQDAMSNKVYKTLSLDSTEPWTADISTDMSTGGIDSSYFVEKEGMWYAFIRRDDDGTYDARAISTQGIGSLLSYAANVITFSFNIGTSISVGDKIYKVSGGSMTLIGAVLSHTSNTITLVSAATTPSPGDIIAFVKNAQAESYGTRGYYMEVELTNSDTTEVEIFAVSSSIFKSNP